ncbi:MAG: adenosine kinase [Aestuariibacter sp.]
MNKYHITALGNALVDIEFVVNEAFLGEHGIEKGVMTLIEKDRHETLYSELEHNFLLRKKASGGCAANTVVTAAQFGASTFYCCKVGNDNFGRFYLEDLADAKVDSSKHCGESQGETGKCLVMISDDADRTMNTYLGITATFDEKQVDSQAIAHSEYLYIEGHLMYSEAAVNAILKAKKVAREHNTKVALTVSDPAVVKYVKDNLLKVIGDDGVDLLFCNSEEASDFGGGDLQAGVEVLKQVTPHLVVTKGKDGAEIYIGDENGIDVAPFAVKAVDTTGAGDTFAGAYLYGITAGLSPELSGELANRTAAECVANYGPRIDTKTQLKIRKEIVESSLV